MNQDVPADTAFSERKLARIITDLFGPAQVVGALLIVVALHSTRTLAAAFGWSVLTVGIAVLIPFVYVLTGVRRRRITDIHVGQREQRSTPILVGIGSIFVSLALLIVLGAPRELVALVAAMTAGLLVTLLVTLTWKISVHAAVASGAVVILALVFGPVWLAMGMLAGLICWARVKLTDHSVSQVVAGTVLGAVVAASVFTLIR
jgi:membrane-associated phospholipid phosphatase